MQRRIECFRQWAIKHGWPAMLMKSDHPHEWGGGLKAIFELWSDGWLACEDSRERTLVWDD
jgi:hypothetical protein